MQLLTGRVLPLLSALCALAAGAVSAQNDVTITPATGGYNVHTAIYDVSVNQDGNLTSLKSDGYEFLNTTNSYGVGGYFHQGDVLKGSALELNGNTITAKSDKAVMKYDFTGAGLTISAQNLTDAGACYFVIVDQKVKAVSDGKDQVSATPVTNAWTSPTFYRGAVKVAMNGSSRLWGPWSDQQVVELTLGAKETKQLSLNVSRISPEETAKIRAIVTPVELRESDITVLSPRTYQVFQRESMYKGRILVTGRVNVKCGGIQATVRGRSLKGDLTDRWQTLDLNPRTHEFSGWLQTIAGGWYTLEIRALSAAKVVATAKVEKVGVGEVFVGAGQSNSTNCGQFPTKQVSGMVSTFNGEVWRVADDPQPGTHDGTTGGSFWPSFGDAMYARFRVPIGVAVTGHGGTNVEQWQPDNPLGLFPWMMTRIRELGPMGFRAVLWHQGESDAQTPTEVYVDKMTTLIRRSQYEAGWSFPWFVAHVSYHNMTNQSWPLVRAAQSELWQKGIAFEGPDTDVLKSEYRDYDGGGIHFSPKGLKAHGEMWADKIGAYIDQVIKK